MIINLKMHFTNKCNYNCEHCMFSCNNMIVENTNKIFDMAKEIKEFLKGYNYRLDLYGGESFLDITLIKEYINNLVNKNCIRFGIPTNGYFLNNSKLLEQINDLFINKTNTREKSKIIISTSEYHEKQWNDNIREVVNNIEKIKQYENLYKLIEIQNTFTTQRILPFGRAKEKNLKCVNPKIQCDLFEDNDDLEISINPNGDISFCDFGYILGNIDNLSISKLLHIKEKSFNNNKNKIFKDLNNVCKKCKKGKYVCAN